jgi:branched-chain amino acid transport system substrate-binding protein
MARVALLIGTSEYSSDKLRSLPAASGDVEALKAVLEDPQLGGFKEVTPLLNRSAEQMAEAIQIWLSQREAEDLALLFISGHGLKSTQSNLFFAAHNTRMNDDGEVIEPTAVPARFVYDRLQLSRAKSQILILDCCFSGAFGKLIPRSSSLVGLEKIFPQEAGRVILTSTNALDYSFEQRSGNMSIYTKYLVQGIESGAADLDGNGWITISELHRYTSKTVKKDSPAMTPQIIVSRDEGNMIRIAKAPIGDPKTIYFKKVEELAEEDEGEISDDGRIILRKLQLDLEISPEEAEQIELEALEAYRERRRKLEDYKRSYIEKIQKQWPLSRKDRQRLTKLKVALSLTSRNVRPIERQVFIYCLLKGKILIFLLKGAFRDIRNFLLWVLILVAIGLLLTRLLPPPTESPAEPYLSLSEVSASLSDEIKQWSSFGEEYIIDNEASGCDKKFAEAPKVKSDFDRAKGEKNFEEALKQCNNAPETLIYKNNASIGNEKAFTIAVIVPATNKKPGIDTEDDAIRMLRGFAQAQEDFNKGEIKIRLLIIDDSDDVEQAKKIASSLINQSGVIAVIGHWSSGVSNETAKIYSDKLVFITPISIVSQPFFFSPVLKSLKLEPNFFRANATVNAGSKALADLFKEKFSGKKPIIFYTEESSYSKSLKDAFISEIGQLDPLNPPHKFEENFQPDWITDKPDHVIVLFPANWHREKAIELAKVNKRISSPLPLMGDMANLAIPNILHDGKDAVDGMILAPSWNMEEGDKKFGSNAKRLWGGEVDWTTAMSYSSANAIIAALTTSNQTRRGIFQFLTSDNSIIIGLTH